MSVSRPVLGTAPPSSPPLVGDRLNMRYELLRELGATAAGTLYAARDLVTKEVLSIKVAPLDPDGGSSLRRRLDHKLRALKGLLHPNTASLHRAGRTGNQYAYVVTEAVHGERLVDMIARRGRLTGAEAAGILRQIVGSLGQAHRQGVTHGGLTSSDVLLEVSQAGPPAVKVVGYGTGWLEQVGPGDSDPTAADDLYSAGLILAEMLTGRSKVPSDSHPVWGHDQGLLGDILRRATQPDPQNRYTRAEQLSSALDAALPKLRALEAPAAETVASVDKTMTGFPRFAAPTGDQPSVAHLAQTKPKIQALSPAVSTTTDAARPTTPRSNPAVSEDSRPIAKAAPSVTPVASSGRASGKVAPLKRPAVEPAESLPTEDQARRAATTAALAPLTLPPLELAKKAAVKEAAPRVPPSPAARKPTDTPVKREPNLGPPPKKKENAAPRAPPRLGEAPRRFDPDLALRVAAGPKSARTPRWQAAERPAATKPPEVQAEATPPPSPARATPPPSPSKATPPQAEAKATPPAKPETVAQSPSPKPMAQSPSPTPMAKKPKPSVKQEPSPASSASKPIAAPPARRVAPQPKGPTRPLPPEQPEEVAARPVVEPVEPPSKVGAGFGREPTRPTMRAPTGEAPLVFVPLKPGGTEVDLTGPVFVAQLWGDAGLTGDHLVVTASRPAVVERGPRQLAWAMLRYTAVAIPLVMIGLAGGYLLSDGGQHALLSTSRVGAVSNQNAAATGYSATDGTPSAAAGRVATAAASDSMPAGSTWEQPMRVLAPASMGGIPAADSGSLSHVAAQLASAGEGDRDPIELTADLGEPERRLVARTLRYQAVEAFGRAAALAEQFPDGADDGRIDRARAGRRRAASQLSDCGQLAPSDHCSLTVEALVWRPELFEQLVATAAALHEASDVLDADDPMRASLVGRSQSAYLMSERLLRNGIATAQLAEHESDRVGTATEWLHYDLSRLHSAAGRCGQAQREAQRIAAVPASYVSVRAQAVACAAGARDAGRTPTTDDVDELLASGTILADRADRVEGRVYRARVRLDSEPPNVRVYLEDTADGRQFLGRTPIDQELESERPVLRLLFSKRRHRARVVEVEMTTGPVDDVVRLRARRSRRSTTTEEPQLRVERID